MDLLLGLRDRHGATLVMVTHSPELALRCDRVVRVADGQIEDDGRADADARAAVRAAARVDAEAAQ
jgi:putative ABC transport system ATP-binding protein